MLVLHQKNQILALLILIGALAPLAADAYLPALSLMSDYFETSDSMLKFSVTAYFIGFALAQIVFGPLSDAKGRRKVILLGLLIGILGALICFVSQSIWQFLIGRCILGIGMASGIPVARAVLKDLFNGVELSKAASSINMVLALMPLIAPLFGAYLASYYQWQQIFQLVFALSLVVLVLTYYLLPETNPKIDPNILQVKPLLQTFIRVLKDRAVFTYSMTTLCAFGCAVAYMVSAPFVFLDVFGFSMIEFGWLAGLITLSYILGGFLNNYLLKKLSPDHIIFAALIGLLVTGLNIYLSIILFGPNLIIITLNVFLLTLSSRMVFPNALAGAFSSPIKEVGVISSVYGIYHTLGAIIASGIMSLLNINPISAMASTMIGFACFGIGVFYLNKINIKSRI
ncbi:multidrug effflux MFS transporter [Marinomonas sp. MED121]|uniref:multidrug effflux MFS transporter n=1 Tax=Marinomonas sp. MED121 TaxID=314277 RepID=UPI0003014BD4|nr:multidrug effflux MFS transporter [Marinomonas sp. MED121]